MSVDTSVLLPNQPATGTVLEHGLGGQGAIAPINQQDVVLQSAGDASGGVNTAFIVTDPHYSTMFAWVTIAMTGLAADVDFQIQMTASEGGIHGPGMDGILKFGTLTPRATWVPPPVIGTTNEQSVSKILPHNVQVRIPNAAGTTLFMSARVYNFRKDIQRHVPLSMLHAVATRGISSS